MAKRKRLVLDSSTEPLNQPFSGLARLRDQLAASTPEGETASLATKAEDRTDENRLAFGAKIIVTREKKGRGGKTVTRVAGLGLEASALEGVTKELKNALGCGAVVEGGDIILQGSLGERVREQLLRRGAKKVIIGN